MNNEQTNRHTPGTWDIRMMPCAVGTKDQLVAIVYPEGDEMRANVRLIKAAPKLLAAAKEALAFIEANGLSHGRALAEAIAEAEGR